MKKSFWKYFKLPAIFGNEDGATAVEYALIASATSLALVATLPAIENGLSTAYSAISDYF